MVKKRRKRRLAVSPVAVNREIFSFLEAMGGSREKSLLSALWQNWQEILGSDLGEIGRPLGARKRLLLVGVEDAMQMQELYFRREEILERVNGFLQSDYFGDASFSVTDSPLDPARKGAERSDLSRENPESIRSGKTCARVATGIYLEKMDPDSPVARCYALFAAKKS